MSFTWSFYAQKQDDCYIPVERHVFGDGDVMIGDACLLSETKEGLVKVLRQAADDIEAQIKVEGE